MAEAKKKREKSPMYPSIGLKNAIAKIKALYNSDGRNFVPKKLAAEAMGYKSKSKSLSGSALQLLSSLRQYGLIVQKKGEVGVSGEAFRILNAPEDSQDKIEALVKCSLNPKIFNQLYTTYQDKLPSDETLIWRLQQQNYTRKAAETLIQYYKETAEYANLSEKAHQIQGEENAGICSDALTGNPPLQNTTILSSKPIVWTFPFGNKTASLAITGGKPNQEEIDSLITILDAFKKTLPAKEEATS